MNEYALRRQRLLTQLEPASVVLLPAAKDVLRNGDGHYPFRQNSDFYYLTGFQEPEAVMVLSQKTPQYRLFNRPRDPLMETWNGKRAGQVGAVQQLGADESYPIEDFANALPNLLTDCHTLYYPMGEDAEFDALILSTLNALRAKSRQGVNVPSTVKDIRHPLHEMRLFKSEAEIHCMQKAATISVNAHRRAMEYCKPGMKEYELQAQVECIFKQQGCAAPAYNSIVGSGENTCILHYNENDKTIENGDLVLIDAGGEYQGYASDITRTFPANGRFTKEQRLIYELVLKAQTQAIALIKPGLLWNEIQDTVVDILVDGLLALNLLSGDKQTNLKNKTYQTFYMHRAGHWLGLDTHDVGAYKLNGEWRPLAEGMVLTVEPGIYIAASADVDSKWWNIGVRIEDDVLVTKTGAKVLTEELVKRVDDIEALMARHP